MRVLIICRCLSIGGAERVAVSWANELQKSGDSVFILTDTSVPQTYTTHDDIVIIPLQNYSDNNSKGISGRFRVIKCFKRIIDKLDIDVIIKVMHVNGLELLIARKLSTKHPLLIMTDHNAYEALPPFSLSLKQKFQKFILNRFFDRVTVLTNRDKSITDKMGLKNVSVLHNPLFLLPEPCATVNKEKIVLAVGRLDSWHIKGFDILIRAWNLICKPFPEWKLRIIGHGSKKSIEYLESLAGGNSQFEILPFKSNIQDEYRKSSIFVLSSRAEGWGLVLVEAMSQRCACIACDFNGRQSEIISDKINGLICKPNDIKDLSSKISELISNESLRLSLQDNAILGLNRFGEKNIAQDLQNIILKKINK